MDYDRSKIIHEIPKEFIRNVAISPNGYIAALQSNDGVSRFLI